MIASGDTDLNPQKRVSFESQQPVDGPFTREDDITQTEKEGSLDSHEPVLPQVASKWQQSPPRISKPLQEKQGSKQTDLAGQQCLTVCRKGN